MIVLPLRFRVIIALCIVISIAMGIAMMRDSKPKYNYEQVSGTIVSIDNHFRNQPTHDVGKFRYLQLDTYPYILELFIGKDFGDFKPKFEQVDNLHTGDVVTVYYYDTNDIKSDGINRHVKFIDKAGENYFAAGSAMHYVGLFIIVSCILLSLLSYYGWKQNKIAY